MEALIRAGLIGLMSLGTIMLPLLVQYAIYRSRLAKVLPVIRRAFEIIDPLLNEHLRGYSSGQVQFILNLVTGVLADGKLTIEEVKFAAREIQSRYKPTLAAGKGFETVSDPTLLRLRDVIEKGMEDGRFTMMDLAEAIKVVGAEVL